MLEITTQPARLKVDLNFFENGLNEKELKKQVRKILQSFSGEGYGEENITWSGLVPDILKLKAGMKKAKNKIQSAR